MFVGCGSRYSGVRCSDRWGEDTVGQPSVRGMDMRCS